MKYWLISIIVLYIFLRVGAVFSSGSNYRTDWKWLANKGRTKDKTK